MTIKRETCITFSTEDELLRAFRDFDLVPFTEYEETYYKDGEYELSYYIAEHLFRHGIELEKMVKTRKECRWQDKDKIKEVFELGKDTDVNVYPYRVYITTHDMTPTEHKREVRKVYKKFRKNGIMMSYSCEAEKTSTTC